MKHSWPLISIALEKVSPDTVAQGQPSSTKECGGDLLWEVGATVVQNS